MITFKKLHEILQISEEFWFEFLKGNPKIPNCISHIEAKGITEQDGILQVVLWVDLEDSEGNTCSEHPVYVPVSDL